MDLCFFNYTVDPHVGKVPNVNNVCFSLPFFLRLLESTSRRESVSPLAGVTSGSSPFFTPHGFEGRVFASPTICFNDWFPLTVGRDELLFVPEDGNVGKSDADSLGGTVLDAGP